MSKLEAAFSKAMRQQAKDKTVSVEERKVADQPVESASSDVVVTKSKPSKSLSAKDQIAGMSRSKVLSDDELADKRIVYPRMKDRALLNIYRNLRTKMLARSPNSNFVTIVTSVVPCGGSSLVAANIAATFAFDEGKTALLIEGNVQTPSLGGLFELEPDSAGLMECLESEEMSLSDILYETGVPRLRFIPAGRNLESSAEFFTSNRMKSLVSEVCDRYPERYPIIDAPSIGESADAQILVELCDYALLVVPYGKCTEDQIRKAALAIGKEKLLGIVLNQF